MKYSYFNEVQNYVRCIEAAMKETMYINVILEQKVVQSCSIYSDKKGFIRRNMSKLKEHKIRRPMKLIYPTVIPLPENNTVDNSFNILIRKLSIINPLLLHTSLEKKRTFVPIRPRNLLWYCRKAIRMKLDLYSGQPRCIFTLKVKGFNTNRTSRTWQGYLPHTHEWRKGSEGLKYGCALNGSKEGVRKANFMVAMSYDKGIVLCKQYMGPITGGMFADIVREEFPAALNASINAVALHLLKDGCPCQNSKVALDAIEDVNAIVMSIPPRSPDLNPIKNIFGQVSRMDTGATSSGKKHQWGKLC